MREVASGSNSKIVTHGFGRGANWQGRSGRSYDLVSENLEHFAMGESDLYMIAKGSHVLWVGSTSELVSDPLSRTRFRLALDCADRVFRLITPGAASERLSTIWISKAPNLGLAHRRRKAHRSFLAANYWLDFLFGAHSGEWLAGIVLGEGLAVTSLVLKAPVEAAFNFEADWESSSPVPSP